jgi:hypothetical protein
LYIRRTSAISVTILRRSIVDAKIPMTSTLAVFVPHFDEKGTPLFRTRSRSWNTLSSAGQGP